MQCPASYSIPCIALSPRSLSTFYSRALVPCSSIATVLHASVRLGLESMRFVPYQGNDHAVEVEEEHDEVETELDEGFLDESGGLALQCFHRFVVLRCGEGIAMNMARGGRGIMRGAGGRGKEVNGPSCGRSVCGISRLRRGGVGCRRS